MLALIITCFAATFAALANLFFKKNSLFESRPNGYLLCYFGFSFIGSLLVQPAIFENRLNIALFSIGGVVGVLNVIGMLLIGKALKSGPAGLIFAFQNASSVFPNFFLYLIFGVSFGFILTGAQVLGLSLVLIGLFLASLNEFKTSSKFSLGWYGLVIGCFMCQLLALTLIQWRCMLFSCAHPHFLIPFQVDEASDAWFMPGFFSIATFLQLVLFLKENRRLTSREIQFGLVGGLANAIATLGLVIATKWASPFEKGVIFPLFAISVISLCNLWGYKLYQEKIDIRANLLCFAGILIATLI